MRWGARTGLLAVLAVGAAAGIVAVPVAQAEASGCREVRIPVEIDGATGDIAGTLCVPPSATRVQVLIPGWLNNRGYWNLAYGSGEYSYVREMNRRGEATLAVDRLGTGSSWHPPSSMVTYAAHVRAIGQVVDALREGTLMPGRARSCWWGTATGRAWPTVSPRSPRVWMRWWRPVCARTGSRM
ncbi:hypothetical protein Ntsu_80780 [Nocardia sp. IFM 10818]